ncbi:carboxypeptidase-like regulatory domain-containing protein [Rufibacter psychrotolerans]|uniref:carboxypeptidase-like regulatory domain-containing protein n=1 Tax=Rufibacter psychrotolerans TaxID=2812556 RepID=UPI0019681544|nr:carboxypeptidase-like regulatory domain-containing protein [Rufibacter sp. SYSU D00308]
MKQLIPSLLLASALAGPSLPAYSGTIIHRSQQQVQTAAITGIVLESSTQKPIAYASVGVLDESTGTISNEEGAFSLSIPAAHRSKKIRISAIGYEPQNLEIEQLLVTVAERKKLEISLVSKPVQLAEVKVDGKHWKKKELGGNAGPFTLLHNTFTIMPKPIQENLGREHGILIPNGPKQSFLSKLNFCLSSNQFEEVKFRVNIYTLHDGKPSQNIASQDIIISVKDKKRGWIQADLEPYNLYMKQDFVLSLEWIAGSPLDSSKSLTLAAALPGFHTIYHKDASQAKWDKMSAAGMGMNVVLQQEN